MNDYRRASKLLGAVFFAALLGVFCVVVAQSGRQIKRTTPLPPVPTPEPSPTPKPQAEKPKPTFTFIVGMDRFGGLSRISLQANAGVLRNCVDRLDDSLAVKAVLANGDLTRADAVAKAKQEKEAHVVWLQLRPQTMSGETGPDDDPYNVYIQYSVFAPLTGKQVTSGNIYPEAYRNRRIRVPAPTINEDYYLNQAARGAAERILAHFHLRLPNTRGLQEQ